MCPILLCTCFQNVQKLCLLGIYLLCCQEYFSFANDYIHRSHYNTFAPAFLFAVLLSCVIAQQCQSSLNEDAHHVLVSDDFLFESSDLYLSVYWVWLLSVEKASHLQIQIPHKL